jgi:hypothetical protein
MGTFRWLVVVSVVAGAIVGGAELAFALFLPPYSFASHAGASGMTHARQLTGQFPSPLMILVVETVSLATALLSGAMYGVSGWRAGQIALWVAAIMLLLPSTLAASSFVFGPSYLPAAILIFLAALFSLGGRHTTGDTDVGRQPHTPSASVAIPRHRVRLILGTALAFLGGVAIIFLFQVSWTAILITLGISSIGATLLMRSPLSAFVVPAAIWLGAIAAVLYSTARGAALGNPILWAGVLEFAAILIVIAVIPALIGVGIGTLATRWIPGASA